MLLHSHAMLFIVLPRSALNIITYPCLLYGSFMPSVFYLTSHYIACIKVSTEVLSIQILNAFSPSDTMVNTNNVCGTFFIFLLTLFPFILFQLTMSEQELGDIVQITVDEFSQEDRTGRSDSKHHGHLFIIFFSFCILRFSSFITGLSVPLPLLHLNCNSILKNICLYLDHNQILAYLILKESIKPVALFHFHSIANF